MSLFTRLPGMASVALGRPFDDWPAWSAGEMVAVAVVTNNHAALSSMDFTIVQALDRLAGEVTVQQLREIERGLS